ncbi:MAG: SDR family NAD(P)-dependent oxidoreductase [Candidatus Aminicenantes bacterium]|nr:SDR family NAD(P)-dependent oxidoreductase [Candidatus Aminicenantes bacterium]NIM83463.1 SDR family NAD(P)-dependent oxidoreductase [Candidatus Aminicenantes bacterium]NIN22855.1 SDR family NAD(P)-dependent oxidoreductase [Candidatus Aminicenantes bacterium]NIN46591.1 SDR family NAD(P)-dependent oxidoreductase [Candidatus Aminicenantes bacterium]NIN89494.1 SDR family NAD(P)-dependent oxidoreductase [Candidatus Aminicenantes bacterium]
MKGYEFEDEDNSKRTGLEIAVIGMAGKFPGAEDIDAFWDNMKNGMESITFFTDEELALEGVSREHLENPNYVKAKGIVKDADCFDASFFDYVPVEAQLMDSQKRLFHEYAWKALENAGYCPNTFDGLIGLYAGASSSFPWEGVHVFSGLGVDVEDFSAAHLKDKDYMCTWVSYKLNLKGPSFTVQTACSTSLVAIHLACRALLTGECDMALAGGVTVNFPQKAGYLYHEGLINSPDGHCRPFDAGANGTVSGEGIGIVVLKPLEDAVADRDSIDAVVKSTAVNNDGLRKMGYTVPSIDGQADVIKMALRFGQVESESIGYLEAHGTATALGDPVEIEALKLAFNTPKKGFCAVGSVKANIGHLDAAAGVAGFIRTVLALKHRAIPPSFYFQKPNLKIDFENSPFFVNRELRKWKNNEYPLRAGVSSFGIGGTNAHAILEEAPEIRSKAASTPARKYELILLSAKTKPSLERGTEKLAAYFKKHPDMNLADAAYTLQVGRGAFRHRRMVVCHTSDEVVAALSSPGTGKVHTFISRVQKRPVIFMFSGQGSQYVNMGLGLYQTEPLFKREMDHCFEVLAAIMGEDIKTVLYPDNSTPVFSMKASTSGASKKEIFEEKINQFIYTSPLKFAFEYSLARLLMTWGIRAYAMIGHSFGEYVAACIAGVFSLEDGLTLAALRGKLMHMMPEGTMMSVSLSEEELRPYLKSIPELSLAAVNGFSLCIVSGPYGAIDALENQLLEKGRECARLRVPRAGHSNMLNPILKPFEEKAKEITFYKPQIPYISGLSGKWVKVREAVDPHYWARHLVETIRFYDGLTELLKEENAVFVQMGSDRSLSTFVTLHPDIKPDNLVINLVRHPKDDTADVYFLMHKIGLLWLYGIQPDWNVFHSERERYRIHLPTYSFDRQRFQLNISLEEIAAKGLAGGNLRRKDDPADWFYVPSWSRSDCSGRFVPVVPQTADLRKRLVFIGNSSLGSKVLKALEQGDGNVVTVKSGKTFGKENSSAYIVNPAKPGDYDLLITRLQKDGQLPDAIVHLWLVTGPESWGPTLQKVDKTLNMGFYSLFHLVRALGKHGFTDPLHIDMVSNNMQEVFGEDLLYPEKTTVLGPVKIIPVEYPNITCRSIDIVTPKPGSRQEVKLASQLARELQNGQSHQPGSVIAYRGTHRWEQTFKPVRLEKPGNSMPPLKEKGVYLLTGGLGGIGLVIAHHLAHTVQAKLVLTTRSAFPDKKNRERWLKSHAEDDPISSKIRKVLELEELGSEVMVVTADAADEEQVQAAVSRVMERFGSINGIIHCAGLPDGAAIQVRTMEMTDKILAPKVKGTLVLEETFQAKGIEPDFVIYCSSTNAVLPAFGQVGHCSANAFLDAMALYKMSKGGPFTVSINWNPWLEVGQAAESMKEAAAPSGTSQLDALLSAEGVDVFTRILAADLSQVVVSTNDFNLKHEQFYTAEVSQIQEEVEESDFSPTTLRSRPELDSIYAPPRNGIEKVLVKIWQRFFGFQQVGVHDNFFALGGDSLKAMTIITKIHRELKVKIPLAEVFVHPTIAELSEFIASDNKEGRFSPIKKAEEKEYYPLSSAQERLYILQRMEPGSTSYNLPQVLNLNTEIHREKLQQTFKKLIQRHESLRTSFQIVNNETVQKIHHHVHFNVNYYDPEKGKNNDSNSIKKIINNFVKPFDLSQPYLLRIGLIKIGEKKHVLVIDKHHIITDGVSQGIMVEDFMALYEDRELPLLRLQYRDYAEWQKELVETGEIQKQETYWLDKFSEKIPVLNLPLDYPRPEELEFEGDSLNFHIGPELTQKVRRFVSETGTTLFILVLALYNVLLAKYTHREDIVVGAPVAGRTHDDLKQIIGMFINMLAMRNAPMGNQTFRQFLVEVKENAVNDFENQDYQFDTLVEKLNIAADANRHPLVETVFMLHNYGMKPQKISISDKREQNNQEKSYHPEHKIAKFDLKLVAFDEREDAIDFNFEYRSKLFKKETIQRMSKHFVNIIREAVSHPDLKISEIQMLTKKEKEELIQRIKGTNPLLPGDQPEIKSRETQPVEGEFDF